LGGTNSDAIHLRRVSMAPAKQLEEI
jgi:hypothetical protein